MTTFFARSHRPPATTPTIVIAPAFLGGHATAPNVGKVVQWSAPASGYALTSARCDNCGGPNAIDACACDWCRVVFAATPPDSVADRIDRFVRMGGTISHAAAREFLDL